jgi:hypothetical protein
MKYLWILLISVSCFGEPTIEEMMGPDKDGNGVRDDIDRFIDKPTKDQDERNAFKQYAKYLRLGFKYYEDKDKSIENTHEKLKALDCISKVWLKYNQAWEEKLKFTRITKEIRSMTFETRKTLEISAKISGDFSGQMSGGYGYAHEVCKFKLIKEYTK